MAYTPNELEKKIRSKMFGIKTGTIKKENSGIGSLFSTLKTADEPLHDELLKDYKKVLEDLKKKGEEKNESN